MNAGGRAKVSDFGMSKFINASPNMTPLTMCPGTSHYMPPEALKEPPVYSKKIDCFSFGVLQVQIMTRQFPNPGPATQLINDPRSPTGRMFLPILDSEHRKSHIILINPTHTLLRIALPCLSYSEEERPSAEDISQKLAILKEGPCYIQSMQQVLQAGKVVQLNAESEMIQTLQQSVTQLSQELECANKQVQEKQYALDAMEKQAVATT